MKNRTTYAVITGDIVGSQKVRDKALLVKRLEEVLKEVAGVYPQVKAFEIFRGDSFQCLIERPALSLRIALLIRLGLYRLAPEGEKWEVRQGIGIGEVEFLDARLSVSQGEAYVLAGKALESMEKSQRLKILTPDAKTNDQLDVSNRLTDAVVERWRKKQAEAAYYALLKDATQEEIARRLGITQAAVQQRLAHARFDAVRHYVRYFEEKLFA